MQIPPAPPTKESEVPYVPEVVHHTEEKGQVIILQSAQSAFDKTEAEKQKPQKESK